MAVGFKYAALREIEARLRTSASICLLGARVVTTVKPPPPDVEQRSEELDQFPTVPNAEQISSPSEPRHADFGRIDVVHAVAGLRHIEPSREPAMVFSHFAAVCVPAVCDEVVIDLVENARGYRIRRPATELTALRKNPQAPGESDESAVLTSDSVTVTIPAAAPVQEEPGFSGVVTCIWTDSYAPTPADASLVQLMVDHAIALVQRERFSERGHRRIGSAQALQGVLSRNRRIASAVGVVMALHHVDHAQAMDLLIRISDRSHIDLQALAETVVTTGSLPAVRRPAGSG